MSRWKPILLPAAIVGVFGYYLWTLYAADPFIQQEIIGLAFWWTRGDLNFFQSLFDPHKTDGYPGRFRYLEYLTEAGYWNLVRMGWVPHHLYDFFNLLLVAMIGFFLFKIARRNGLSRGESWVCLAFFWLSIPAFMVVAFHFRKAKVLATLWLAMLLYLFSLPERQKFRLAKIALVILGCFSDPFFILFAPLLGGVLDFQERPRTFFRLQDVFTGLCISAFLVLLINGWIGPQFHPACRVVLTEIPHKPKELFALGNLKQFQSVLPDIFAPALFHRKEMFVGWVLSGLLACLFWFRLRPKIPPYFLAFILSVFTTAFAIQPAPHESRFSSYYGFMLIFILSLALMEWLRWVRDKSNTWRFGVLGIVLVCVGLHQWQKEEVLSRWRERHFTLPTTRTKFLTDYQELLEINQYLKQKHGAPYLLKIDFSNLESFSFRDLYEKGEEHLHRRRTYLAYFLMPILYESAIEKGEIMIVSQ